MAMFVEFASDDELHLVVVVVACGGGSSAASTRVLPERMTMATMRPMRKEGVADVLKAILVFCVCLGVKVDEQQANSHSLKRLLLSVVFFLSSVAGTKSTIRTDQ